MGKYNVCVDIFPHKIKYSGVRFLNKKCVLVLCNVETAKSVIFLFKQKLYTYIYFYLFGYNRFRVDFQYMTNLTYFNLGFI